MLESDFRILGPLEVWHAGRRVDVAGARQRALLSVLLLQAGEVVSSDRLIDEVWGDDPPTAGATALRVRISQLRRSLGPVGELLVTRAPGYVMRLQTADQLDLRRFERLAEEGGEALARGDPRGAAETLRRALELWRGPPLGDVGGAPFAPIASARLQELRIVAIELRVEAELGLGQHARLVAELRALVEEHPLRERLWGLLMTALYRDGRQADALAAYREARRRLVDEIGLEPGPDLHELERRILAHDSTLHELDTPANAHAPLDPRAAAPRYRPRASPSPGGAARRPPRPGSAHRRARRRPGSARRGHGAAEHRAVGGGAARGTGAHRRLHVVRPHGRHAAPGHGRGRRADADGRLR